MLNVTKLNQNIHKTFTKTNFFSCQFFDNQHQKFRKNRAKFLILIAWISGITIAIMPLMDIFKFASNTKKNFNGLCYFTVVCFFVSLFN